MAGKGGKKARPTRGLPASEVRQFFCGRCAFETDGAGPLLDHMRAEHYLDAEILRQLQGTLAMHMDWRDGYRSVFEYRLGEEVLMVKSVTRERERGRAWED